MAHAKRASRHSAKKFDKEPSRSSLGQTAGVRRLTRIARLLDEVAELMKSEQRIDPLALSHLKQIQVRMRFAGADAMRRPKQSDKEPPTVAPTLWLDRKNRDENPVDFVRRVYARWLGRGLTRAHIRKLDRSLYLALYFFIARGGILPPGFDLPTRKDLKKRSAEVSRK